MLVALLALFLGTAGGATAAGLITGKRIKNGSVTSADIRNNSLRGKDIRRGTVASSDVKNGSLLAGDFAAGQLPAGPRGPAGRNGTNGFGTLAYPFDAFDTPSSDTNPHAAFVPCASGLFPTGGDAIAVDTDALIANDFVPVPGVIRADGIDFDPDTGMPDGYFAAWQNDGGQNVTIFIDAVCANATTVRPNGKRAREGVRRSGMLRLGH